MKIKPLIILFSLILLTLVLCSCGEQLQNTTVGTVKNASAVVEQENKDSAEKQQVYDDVLNSVK